MHYHDKAIEQELKFTGEFAELYTISVFVFFVYTVFISRILI
jgi:hypothetical protein